MIPIHIDPAHARIALIGRDDLTLRRLAWLQDAGAEPEVWSDAPSADLLSAAPKLEFRLPGLGEIARYHALWIADLAPEEAAPLARAARDAHVLVNVEDQTALCDFHTPAIVRRGKLTISAGTGGASPAVARAVRERLEQAFPHGWRDAIEDIAEARAALRRSGVSMDALAADARERLRQRGLI
ncbi:MAG: NAD(P)-dependent oxidoreductase [Terricaulis sp.]